MMLYETDNNKLFVYSLSFNDKLLKEYKEENINNIKKYDEDELFFYLETTNYKIKNDFCNKLEFDMNIIKPKDGHYTELKPVKKSSKFRELLQKEKINNYINGYYDKNLPIKEYSKNGNSKIYLNNFLLTSSAYKRFSNYEKRDYYFVDDIICLPDNLYTLQLFLNEKFKEINNENLDLSEIKNLVNVKQIYEFDLIKLNNFFNSKLIEETYEDTLNKVNETSKILKKVKKTNYL